ncbi:hypothetical protein HK098_000565 [Nowakowskiella sp. JEL0407]|nr:hypothetical protein HK098_000565 [Nowakowskiella sp. JEL0407]
MTKFYFNLFPLSYVRPKTPISLSRPNALLLANASAFDSTQRRSATSNAAFIPISEASFTSPRIPRRMRDFPEWNSLKESNKVLKLPPGKILNDSLNVRKFLEIKKLPKSAQTNAVYELFESIFAIPVSPVSNKNSPSFHPIVLHLGISHLISLCGEIKSPDLVEMILGTYSERMGSDIQILPFDTAISVFCELKALNTAAVSKFYVLILICIYHSPLYQAMEHLRSKHKTPLPRMLTKIIQATPPAEYKYALTCFEELANVVYANYLPARVLKPAINRMLELCHLVFTPESIEMGKLILSRMDGGTPDEEGIFPRPDLNTIKFGISRSETEAGIAKVFKRAVEWNLNYNAAVQFEILSAVERVVKKHLPYERYIKASELNDVILTRSLNWVAQFEDTRRHSNTRTAGVVISRKGHPIINVPLINKLISHFASAEEFAGGVSYIEKIIETASKSPFVLHHQISHIQLHRLLSVIGTPSVKPYWPKLLLSRLFHILSKFNLLLHPNLMVDLLKAATRSGHTQLLSELYESMTVESDTKVSLSMTIRNSNRVWRAFIVSFADEKCGSNLKSSISVAEYYLNECGITDESKRINILKSLFKTIKTRAQASIFLPQIFKIVVVETSRFANDFEVTKRISNEVKNGIERIAARIVHLEESHNSETGIDLSEKERARNIIVEIITRRLQLQAEEIQLDTGVDRAIQSMTKWVETQTGTNSEIEDESGSGMLDVDTAIDSLASLKRI